MYRFNSDRRTVPTLCRFQKEHLVEWQRHSCIRLREVYLPAEVYESEQFETETGYDAL